MSAVTGWQLEGVEEIFGIKRIRAIDVRIACDEVVTAKVEFLLDEIQAKAFLQLCNDGKWRSPPAENPGDPVETTCLSKMPSRYRTHVPAE